MENLQLTLSYLDQVLIFVCFAVSLNLLQGYAGQVSVAHAAFGAVGGYALGYLVLNAHVGALEAMLAGTLGAALVGAAVAFPALRLTTEWLILLTLAVQTIIMSLVTTVSALGGTYGLQNISGLTIFGHELDQPSDMFPLFLVLTVLVYAVCWRIGESPYGRVLRGIREDEIACRSLGKNVFLYKTSSSGSRRAWPDSRARCRSSTSRSPLPAFRRSPILDDGRDGRRRRCGQSAGLDRRRARCSCCSARSSSTFSTSAPTRPPCGA
jgi:ABC-type branched-subunit amino acid transport system permease subunit